MWISNVDFAKDKSKALINLRIIIQSNKKKNQVMLNNDGNENCTKNQ